MKTISMDGCDDFKKVRILQKGSSDILVSIVTCWYTRNRGCNLCVCSGRGVTNFTFAKHKPHIPWPLPILMVIQTSTSPALAHCWGISIRDGFHCTSGSDGGISRGHMSIPLLC